MRELPIDYLRECLDYDPQSGNLTWRVRPESHFSTKSVAQRFNSLYAGKIAGGRVANGYLMLPFKDETGKRVLVYAHRIAFALHHGKFPLAEVDHINGDRVDNRASNLREATRIKNAANSVFDVDNMRGVRRRSENCWTAQMSFQGRNVYLGSYSTEAEAHAAFCGAAILARREFAKLDHSRDAD
ncbi:HNH endonuclease [Burkholderia gladioli]|uniref:HNH endonuclease n=1 Tax=Burkholderia gladioli TaxID=28095 RepID=UPI00264AE3FB|nr:HNH endonuclease [Burkholderia gladioli]MDN7812084.1 HNH endonuclease [Burkholderia gladioli]